MEDPNTSRIPVYSPNISTDKLVDLITLHLDDLAPWVSFERISGKTRFRAPDLQIILRDKTRQLQVSIIQYLIEAAKLLGATQFTIVKDGFTMRQQPTDMPPQRIEQLLIAFNTFEIEQINIY